MEAGLTEAGLVEDLAGTEKEVQVDLMGQGLVDIKGTEFQALLTEEEVLLRVLAVEDSLLAEIDFMEDLITAEIQEEKDGELFCISF